MDATTTGPTVLTAEAITALPLAPLGAPVGRHSHRANHHSLWVLDGRAAVLGTELGPGDCAHIPSGVEHDVDATGSDGCTVFYLYVRLGG